MRHLRYLRRRRPQYVNAVAGSFAERVPIVVISAGPDAEEHKLGVLIRHKAKDIWLLLLGLWLTFPRARGVGIRVETVAELRRALTNAAQSSSFVINEAMTGYRDFSPVSVKCIRASVKRALKNAQA